MVRVHERTITGGSIQVVVQAVSLTSEEPETDFVSASALASVTLSASAPVLHLASLTPPFGAMVRVVVVGTGQTASTITATLGIDLVVRTH